VGLQRFARVGFVLGTVAIVWLSLLPGADVPALGLWDKLEHTLAYGTVAAIGAVGWAGRARDWARVAVFLATLGAVLEVLQTMVPGRLGDVGDAAANVIGTFAGMSMVALLGWIAGRAGRVGGNW